MLGLSARYNDGDCVSSSDSSVVSRCNSPQVDLFHSLDSSLESYNTSQRHDEILSDNAEQDGVSLGDASDSPSSDVFTAASPLNSLPANYRPRKHRQILQTALARTTVTDHCQSDKLSQSVDEHVTCSTPDLHSSSRSLSETSDRQSMIPVAEGETCDRQRLTPERHRTRLRGSLALVSQVTNSFQPHFIVDSKRRRRHVAKHIFTGQSTEPQLVSLRRFCDDYRTSCLQQNLIARRCSLDRMLSADSPSMDTVTSLSTIHQLSNVADESGPSSTGISSVSCPLSDLHVEVSTSPVSSAVDDDGVSIVVGESNAKDPVTSTQTISFMSTPTDDRLHVEYDRTTACDKADCNISEQLSESVGSCVTEMSVISDSDSSAECEQEQSTADNVVEDTAESYCTVVNTASADEEHSCALSQVDDEQLIEHVTTATDLLLLLDGQTSEQITCRHDDDMQVTQCSDAADDLLLPHHSSHDKWLSRVDNAVTSGPSSTGDLINFSQTSDELTSSLGQLLSENCFVDILDSHIANKASGSEASYQLNTPISTQMCPGSYVLQTMYKEADDTYQQLSTADSGLVMVSEALYKEADDIHQQHSTADSGLVMVSETLYNEADDIHQQHSTADSGPVMVSETVYKEADDIRQQHNTADSGPVMVSETVYKEADGIHQQHSTADSGLVMVSETVYNEADDIYQQHSTADCANPRLVVVSETVYKEADDIHQQHSTADSGLVVVSETVYKEADDIRQQHNTADSGLVMVNDEDEETCL